MNLRLLLPAVTALSLAACATAPKPLQGQFAPVTPSASVASPQVGTSVRWGGKIIATKPGQGQTCFQMLSHPLDASGRPSASSADASEGRFLACRSGFYDPAVFEPGRLVTFIGKIAGYEDTKIGEYDYKLPRIEADVVYLWPVQQDVRVVPYPYGPWGPYDPWWGPGWGPRWGRW